MRLMCFAVLAMAAVGLAGGAPPTAPPTILVLGDSLSAAYGLAREDGWVALLEGRLRERGLDFAVVNAGISGDTSAGGTGPAA